VISVVNRVIALIPCVILVLNNNLKTCRIIYTIMDCAICEKECLKNLSEICMPCILENYGEESEQWWRFYK
jgi:hypothetical protein